MMKLNIVGEVTAVKVAIRILILINSNKATIEEPSNQIANKIDPISNSILLNMILRLSGSRLGSIDDQIGFHLLCKKLSFGHITENEV